jgi:hypothetical protein
LGLGFTEVANNAARFGVDGRDNPRIKSGDGHDGTPTS